MPRMRIRFRCVACAAAQSASIRRGARLTHLLGVFLVAVSALAGPKPIVLDPAYDHDKWHTSKPDIVRKFNAYTVSFDGNDDDNGDNVRDNWRIPHWVAYEIKRFAGKLPHSTRPSWFTDDDLFAQGIAPRDESYKGDATTWNRGHMCMKEIASRLGKDADYNTHSLLNAVPQADLLNKGIWLDLEHKTAEWADRYGRVWVICGPVFATRNTPTKWIGGKNELKVAVPDYCFKIVVRQSTDSAKPEVLAFEYPNTNSKSVLRKRKPYDHAKFQVTVDKIEKETGLDFLTALKDDVERKVEAQKAPIWP